VNSDWVILEPVDGNYQPVRPGEPSRTVLATSLSNRVQPIVRYDLGDSITVLPDPCRCGSPLPTIAVEGRTDEILSFRVQTGDEVHLLPTALTTSIAHVPGITRFQVIKKGSSTLLVRLEFQVGTDENNAWGKARQNLEAVLGAHGLTNVTIERADEAPTPSLKSGKFRQVWAEI
jgi:phenylacetate-coenzyme A ligase PaaK-like adenylate-forming protein